MRRRLRVLALMVLLLEGCGSGGAGTGANSAAVGFVNQTQHTDAELWALWKAAQQNLSQQIDLNPLQRTQSNVPPDILPGDPRVWNISAAAAWWWRRGRMSHLQRCWRLRG